MGQETLDAEGLPEEERKRHISAVKKMIELGMGAAYGVEEPGGHETSVDCGARLG